MKTQVRYRIHTEAINIGFITAITGLILSGATIYKGLIGLWQGESESSLIVESVGTSEDLERVIRLAQWIKTGNLQEAVLITQETIGAQLV